MTEPFEIPFALADQWDEMLKTKGKLATYWEIAKWGYGQHERLLLDAMHSIVSPLYEPDDNND
mgnify:CR=1 FL=1